MTRCTLCGGSDAHGHLEGCVNESTASLVWQIAAGICLGALVAGLLMIAGCGPSESKVPLDATTAPSPHWRVADKNWGYGHWECPEGYELSRDMLSKTVSCMSEVEANQKSEDWQKSYAPVGAK